MTAPQEFVPDDTGIELAIPDADGTVRFEFAEQPPKPLRVALCLLPEEILVRLLRLPDGWHIAGVAADFERNGITLRLVGPTAPECAPGEIPWSFTPTFEYEAPSPEEREKDEHAAGTLRVILPDWLLEGDDQPWRRAR
jgi:hypothetical protein